jgi:hypothetical protein
MKKVIKEQKETVNVSETNVNKFYGVDFLDDSKGFVTYRLDVGFIVQSCFYLTQCQLRFKASSFDEELSYFVGKLVKEYNVYEFETYQELFRWLSE